MTISKALKLQTTALFCVLLGAAGIFGQTDTPRRTTAITYPLDELVTVQFRGTTRFPRMKGEARIKRTSRNGSQIELSVSKMPRPFELGAGYATYVLWAISPDGQVDNLGEIKRRGFFEFDSKMSVTTPLQTFALIITAEPHFLVRRPSQEIMLENLSPYTASGKVIATTPSIQYFGNSSDYFRDTRTPEIAEVDYSKTPSAILQAKQAVALARYAGADRDAADELREAEALLTNAEGSWKANRDEEIVDIAARKSISAAVKAENTAIVRKEAREKRNERTRSDAEARQAEDKYTDAQNQIADLKGQIAAETRNRELSERDVQTYSTQIRDLREENGRLREELGRMKVESDTVKARLATIESEKQASDQQREREAKISALQASQPALMQSLKRFGTVASTERGIVLTLPETLWSAVRASTFAPNADTKISGISEVLQANPEYRVTIESHTDNRGVAEELTALTDQRARAIADRLSVLGVPSDRIEAKGLGSSLPVAPNTTAASRSRNRRVQIVLVPAIS
ncbi:MAG TPA: OmpA family protein [Pyrinomonadaceae bacterium]|nr:OmpA family protein [Pyrinomonadaceae bacterium]